MCGVPSIAAYDKMFALFLLSSGVLFYAIAEQSRLRGRRVFLVSSLTMAASRPRDAGRFVMGPVTLGIGAMLSLMLYPDTSATIAIYALAFGDGLASLVGRIWGRIQLPGTGGKTLEGSTACFLAVTFVTFRITGNPVASCLIGIFATMLEALPSKDFDNVLMPVGVGFVAYFLVD